MKSLGILFGLIISSSVFSAAQELSKRKCDEYSRKNDALPEQNQYRKYMDKFVIAKTTTSDEYDAVLVSEDYVLTSVPGSSGLTFTEVIINNQTIEAVRQEERDNIYLIKLRANIEVYNKIVCLWNHEELPDRFGLFTVVHEANQKKVPLLRTYVPYTNCSIVQPDSRQNRDNFCLNYENGREYETVFQNPTASPLIFLKSFQNNAGLHKNHYIVGILKQTDIIYGRKLWPNLRWIENVLWNSNSGVNGPLPLEAECGTIVVANTNYALISNSSSTYRGEFPWQAALFQLTVDGNRRTEHYHCGGSLLNRDTVLTAAHCITNKAGELLNRDQFLVKLGLYYLDGTESDILVTKVFQFIKHELYNASATESDIGIIKLEDFASYTRYIRPICLTDHTREFQADVGIIAGWGSDEHKQMPNDQRQGLLLIPSRSECRHSASDVIRERLSEENYCAASQNGQNSCPGDSGSGMIALINKRWYVRGIVSYGGVNKGACNPGSFTLFTNTTYFYDWIVSNML